MVDPSLEVATVRTEGAAELLCRSGLGQRRVEVRGVEGTEVRRLPGGRPELLRRLQQQALERLDRGPAPRPIENDARPEERAVGKAMGPHKRLECLTDGLGELGLVEDGDGLAGVRRRGRRWHAGRPLR